MAILKYINTEEQLSEAKAILGTRKQIALDLEFDNNLHHYGFKLCLIQIFDGSTIFLIDPIFIEIEQIFPIIENNNIQKVVFAFGEDIRLLQSLGCKPKNIFDTSIALKLLNYEKVSLSDMLINILNIQVYKDLQISDWYNRPLTENQKIYAGNDVLFLLDSYKLLIEMASQKNIMSWIDEENQIFDNMIFSQSSTNIINKKERYELTEFQWFFYNKLWKAREVEAKKLDKPAHQVINNHFLKEIAINPKLIKGWSERKFIHNSLKNIEFENLLTGILASTEEEAKEKNISKSKLEIKRIEREDMNLMKKRRIEINNIKDKVFKPIQSLIIRDYGEFCQTFVLSNRLMLDLANGDKSNLRSYKKKLFLKYAKELGIEIEKYL